MIDIIIASYNEPKSTLRAVQKFLSQKTSEKIRVTVVDPFPEVEEFLSKHLKDPRFVFYPDPGEGKAYALNLLFQEYASTVPSKSVPLPLPAESKTLTPIKFAPIAIPFIAPEAAIIPAT